MNEKNIADEEVRANYLVPENTETSRVINAFISERNQTHKKFIEFAKKFDSKSFYFAGGGNLDGIIFQDKDKKPDGWVRTGERHYNAYRPTAKNNKDQYKEFKSLPAIKFSRDLGNELNLDSMWEGLSIHHPSYEEIGDKLIFSHHKDAKVPDDVIPLKNSEYWKIKEDFESK